MCALVADPIRLEFADHAAMIFVVVLFAAAVEFPSVQRAISWRPFLLFGFVSYPLYLIHGNILIGTENAIAKSLPSMPSILVPVIPLTGLTIAAWIIVIFFERPIGNLKKIAFRKLLPA
jgi:peptidoglycan/LPS O-acetylase OafA/YrhL